MWWVEINYPITEEGISTYKLANIIFNIFYPFTILSGIIGAIWLILLGLWWVILVCFIIIFLFLFFIEILIRIFFNNRFYEDFKEGIKKGKLPFIRPFIRIFLFNFFIIQAVYSTFDTTLRPYLINSYPVLPLLLMAYCTSSIPFYLSLKTTFKTITLLEISLREQTTLDKFEQNKHLKEYWDFLTQTSRYLEVLGAIEYILPRSLILVESYALFLMIFFILKTPEKLSSLFPLIYTTIFVIVPYFQLKGLTNVIKRKWKCSNCGYTNDIGSKFCSRCGKNLNAPSTSSL